MKPISTSNFILTSIAVLPIVLTGCAHSGNYSSLDLDLEVEDDLKGLDKIDILKKFGRPLATSQSACCECWYYVQPQQIWIWFNSKDKVDRWEIK